ncbi:ABC transporter permease [Microbacterium sp. EYE_5]|uniref:ABC transporter permease n=1 Tax=unclassified Microbacterium TaxID=2609290 RepID=UPI002005C714|nr:MULTISPECIES: ABC transporter permease [unclassified Microbacterium]MCK6084606.1 ABC transporter permease [Microbacterium sp. EYE_384]MCK6125370.1 ABC transporter permease [Microbacterium sp. EYE_79]MCK6079336.1 ABC transporter permease [Microbacterium sp. EYE_382]MCK6123165.1 ABC transporter permease [Microbacterium sp. EYE_80]MCK6140290.1 ABC transporter permease [Microbacterium sp. EYE_39]
MNAPVSSPSFGQSIWLVTERELGSKLRSKSFVISTVVMFVIVLAAVLWAGFASQTDSRTPIAVTSETAAAVDGNDAFDVIDAATADEARELVRSGDVDAALVPGGAEPLGFTVVFDDEASNTLLQQLSIAPEVEVLNPGGTDGFLRYIIAIAFGGVFFAAALTFGTTIATSVVEEKQTRVVELLISAIPTRALLAGKVLGNTILAMGQIVGIAAVAVVGLTVTGQDFLIAGLGGPIAWFAVFFLFGFVLLAALFAAAGAMVSRQEDIGPTITPLTYIVMAPYFLVIFFNDNPVVLTIMSYVPFSAPVGMPVRIFVGEAQWWEPLLALVVMLAACIAAILVGAKIYENSLLRMGARVKLREALSR